MKHLTSYIEVIKAELKLMLRDSGIMLIMLGAIFIYSSLYAMAYYNQTLTSMPIAVIDNSNSNSSREFIRALNISPNVSIEYESTDLESAKHLFFKREIHGIVIIPASYETDILATKQTVISIYADASYFLMYKQLFIAFTSTMMHKNIEIEVERFLLAGQPEPAAQALAEPVMLNTTILYNRIQGYATFVMPALMILILQQVLLLGIGMIGGTQRERNLYISFASSSGERYSTLSVLMGKITAYFLLSTIICFCIFGTYYKILGYPVRSSDIASIVFFVPYILSCITLGISLSTLFRYRETSILMLVAWSLPFLLLSGVSFPKQGMPEILNNISLAIPSTSAINGFNRYHVMGVPINDISSELHTMWALAAIYFVIAFFAIKKRLNIEFKGVTTTAYPITTEIDKEEVH